MRSIKQTIEQRYFERIDAQEFYQISKICCRMPATMARREDRAAAGRRANRC